MRWLISLKAQPGAKLPQNIEEVRDLVEAVILLCEDGEFKVADNLYSLRLSEGGYGFNVFRDLPAVAEGLECALAFVGDEARRQKVEKILGKSKIGFHCSGVALYNYYLGNLVQALEWRNKDLAIRCQLQDKHSQAFNLHELSLVEMTMGNIRQAHETVSQALSLSHETRNLSDLRSEFACKAYYEFLLGNTSRAYQDFEITFFYFQKKFTDQQFLYSLDGNQQAEFFIRLQAWKLFEAVNAWNIQECKKYHWNDNLAVCHLLQGWYEICQGQLSLAEKALAQAERILRPSGMVQEICRLDWVWVLLAEAKGEYQKGLQRANDALFTCADKGFRLWQADLLVLRCKLFLMQFQKEGKQDKGLLEKAGDDGHEALKIAEQTGYIWAKVEALKLLAKYHQIRATLPNFSPQDEKDLARRHAKEAESLKSKLFLTEEQMKELKAQARKEFEKQVAGWDKHL